MIYLHTTYVFLPYFLCRLHVAWAWSQTLYMFCLKITYAIFSHLEIVPTLTTGGAKDHIMLKLTTIRGGATTPSPLRSSPL